MLKDCGPLAKITLLLFKDVIAIYNLIVQVLQRTISILLHNFFTKIYPIDIIFDLKGGLALLLDELYSDTIQVTQKLKHLVEKNTLIPSYQIPTINYFNLNSEFNRQEELYILEVKKAKAQKGHGKPEPFESYKAQYQALNPGKRLYKLNTKADHLTKIEMNQRDKDYFNLVSPDPSQLEEDFDGPSHRVDGGELLPTHSGMILAETDAQSYKDIRNPKQLEIQLNKNRRSQSPQDLFDPTEPHNLYENTKNYHNMKLQYDHREDKPSSVIFTPTAKNVVYQFGEDGGFEELPQNAFQKSESAMLQHDDKPWEKRNMNFNLGNF